MQFIFTWNILIAAIASFILGAIWYTPAIFGKTWMKHLRTPKKELDRMQEQGIKKEMTFNLIATLITAFVLAQLHQWIGVASVLHALGLGLVLAVGLMLTYGANEVLWERRPIQLYAINRGYETISILLISIILVL